MDYRTVEDMYDRGTLVQLTDQWTPGLSRYQSQPAVIIDIEVIGFPRAVSRSESGTTVTEKYDCIYTVALMPERKPEPVARDQVAVIRVISLDIAQPLTADGDSAKFAAWCLKTFCGVEPEPIAFPDANQRGLVVAGVVMPHTIPMFEAQHRPNDHRRKSLAAIADIHRRLAQWQPDVVIIASTHWMPRDGFYIDDGAMHGDGCDQSYAGIEPQRFSFPGDPELAKLAAHLARNAGLPVRRLHRVAQEHAVWVPAHLVCREKKIPIVPCSIWWRGPREAHKRFGEVLADAVRQLGRRALFVASGGLSHTFDFSQPPEYVVPTGARFDTVAMDWLLQGDHQRLLSMPDEEFESWNPEGRAGHLYMLRGAIESDLPGELLCYQGSNGTGYLTMVFRS
jgi:aromatic ring-opening dioxygenase catalytic subunit (LigB family)